MSENQAAVFSIEKLYVKDLSVEVPNAPAIFLEQEAPQVEMQLRTEASPVGEGFYEVVLTVTATARVGEKVYFLVEAGQAGVFRVQNVPEAELEPLLAIGCPNILFPYAREVVSSATSRAGFAPVILNPVNFEALYMQRLAEAQQQGGHEVAVQ